MHNNLTHVLQDTCTDNNCELHHIDVAIEEEVVNDTNIAFWLAGVMWLRDHWDNFHPDAVIYEATQIAVGEKPKLPITRNPRNVETDLLEDR